jgi:hypothetical protein
MPAPCSWCGAALQSDAATFCSVCKAPQTCFGNFLYGANFLARNLAIPLAIGLVTLILTNQQQEAALIVANRQKLAEALGEVGKVQADYHLADSQIALLASAKADTVPAKELKDAVLRLDLAIASFGAKLGPFEEFARRTKYLVHVLVASYDPEEKWAFSNPEFVQAANEHFRPLQIVT